MRDTTITRATDCRTVLLAEDEDAIRCLLSALLRTQGYQVLEASDGRTAVQVAALHDGPIDLLLSDVMMPGLTGPEVFVRLMPDHPEIKALFISGVPDGFLDCDPVFLRKPFAPAELLDKVSEILCA
jgi:two-component system, cell cycle sensor histidine kinase and response regulator CckA